MVFFDFKHDTRCNRPSGNTRFSCQTGFRFGTDLRSNGDIDHVGTERNADVQRGYRQSDEHFVDRRQR